MPKPFNPADYDFSLEAKLWIVFDTTRQRYGVEGSDCPTIDEPGAGVYAWTTREGGQLIAKYIGLFGKRRNRSMRRRLKDHVNGLNRTLSGKPPTRHWQATLFPGVEATCRNCDEKIGIHFRFVERADVKKTEDDLIAEFQPDWNSDGITENQ